MKFFFYKWVYVLSKPESRLEEWAWMKMCREMITNFWSER
jgi:hypothetical protein